ncbi:DUF3793 family protein [uncultured Desulfuromonas sp.]|uniref:DUF3793 family protein n=1 Tax=uncultured Desulfuromonas sp. TaxID=181013 RepID=UPI002AAA93B5|nr:DUF3793 family protein [uncultured Desulfuromonas sp.]
MKLKVKIDSSAPLCSSSHLCCKDSVQHQARQWSPSVRTSWKDVSGHFPSPQECLAAFLVLSAAEVLEEVKPANLVRISHKPYACGRNIADLWQKHGQGLMADSPLQAYNLCSEPGRYLLLIYHPDLLQKRLSSLTSRAFLTRLGYRQPHSIETVLEQLAQRFALNNELPHEIGWFLGYPLKDVEGFMGRKPLNVSGQRLWKIYGRPHRSNALADLYHKHHHRVARQLCQQQRSSVDLLQNRAFLAV